MLLGLFCWFLSKVFPTRDEFELFEIKVDDFLGKEDKDSSRVGIEKFKGREKLYR